MCGLKLKLPSLKCASLMWCCSREDMDSQCCLHGCYFPQQFIVCDVLEGHFGSASLIALSAFFAKGPHPVVCVHSKTFVGSKSKAIMYSRDEFKAQIRVTAWHGTFAKEEPHKPIDRVVTQFFVLHSQVVRFQGVWICTPSTYLHASPRSTSVCSSTALRWSPSHYHQTSSLSTTKLSRTALVCNTC